MTFLHSVCMCCSCCYVSTTDIVDQELYHSKAGRVSEMNLMPNSSFFNLFTMWLLGGVFGCHRFKSRHFKMGQCYLVLWLAVFVFSMISAINISSNNASNQRVLYSEFSDESCSTEPIFQYVLRPESVSLMLKNLGIFIVYPGYGKSNLLIPFSFDNICLFLFTTAQLLFYNQYK